MERLVCGTEHQLGVVRKDGDREGTNEADLKALLGKAIQVDNILHIFGVPAQPSGDAQVNTRLFNGGLIYLDLGHPEYATPEFRDLDDVAPLEWAGRRIVPGLLRLARLKDETLANYLVVANNTDYQGGEFWSLNTFAYHENYSVDLPNWQDAQTDILPFLATRQIFAGSGAPSPSHNFALSPRALAARHEEAELMVGRYSRMLGKSRHYNDVFHIALGEANVSPYATKLKIGTTALVLQLLEDGWRRTSRLGEFSLTEKETIRIIRNIFSIATDPEFKWIYRTGMRRMPAIEVQRVYLRAAKKMYGTREDTDTKWILREWEATLDQLERDPLGATRLDWVKKYLLFGRLGKDKFTPDELVRVDMSYHRPYHTDRIYAIVGGEDFVPEDKVTHFMNHAPANTRAAGRGIALRAIASAMDNGVDERPLVTWGSIRFAGKSLDMPQPQLSYSAEARDFAGSIEGASRGPERR